MRYSELRSNFLRTTYWINDWVHGSKIRREYDDIVKKMKLPIDEDVNNRADLKELLEYAVANCPFYSHNDASDLFSFPVVNKLVLIDNYDSIAVPVDRIPGQKGIVHIQKTSGSTGTPFAIPQDTRKRNRRIAELKYFGEIVGFKSHDPLCQLRIWTNWQSKTKRQSLRQNIYPFNVADMSDQNLSRLVDLINEKQISCLRSYASSYTFIADYFKRNKLNCPSLKVAISGSEALLETTRDLVNKYMGCEIISQYADEECGIIGQEKLGGSPNCFYLNHASYVIEILKLDEDIAAEYGELGRVVLTDLTNRAFPMIRYDTGDVAILHQPDETSHSPYFSALFGRRLDLVYDVEGNPIHPMVLNRVLKNFDGIKQWQFIQIGEKDYMLKIVPTETKMLPNPTIAQSLTEYFGKDANIRYDCVNEIPTLKSGKRKSVVNEWKHV